MSEKYYSTKEIDKTKALYRVIFGERSNGKTTAVLGVMIENCLKTGEQCAIIRRYRDDFVGKRGDAMFDGVVALGWVKKFSNDKYDNIIYYSSRWYFAKWDEKSGRFIREEKPFCYAFSLASMEHDKSTSYPLITKVLFDEFITGAFYLNDEFSLFQNVLSTIIRDRDNVIIYMCANTINTYNPYFVEMGLTKAKSMKQGTIDIYTYGKSKLKVAVEYCGNNGKSKKSDDYFAFNSPKLKMITEGKWQIDVYPHLPMNCKYKSKNVRFLYFIEWQEQLYQCEIIRLKNSVFTFIHRKTTPLQNENKDLIYKESYDERPNVRRNITKPMLPIEHTLLDFFRNDKVFYQDNEVGNAIENYLKWCSSN